MPRRCARRLGVEDTSGRLAERSSGRWMTRCRWSWPPPRRRSLPPRPNASGLAQFPTGVLNVNKAAGETSFSVVSRLRRLAGAHRVGHAGTLDPLATGVLPILFESATRLAEFALKQPKTYVAPIQFGVVTQPDD